MHPDRLKTATLSSHPWGDKISRILAAALDAVDPYRVVKTHFRREGNELAIGGKTYNLNRYEKIYLVGAGKAGQPMAQAAAEVLGEQLTGGLVIVKEGYAGGEEIKNLVIAEAGHPLPDERGVRATQEMLEILAQTTERDLVVCLISGGGSALLTAPQSPVTLVEMRILTESLLACGAMINEINTLRKQLDRVKGGGLAQAAAPAEVATLILSDVVGDPLDMIASGPTVQNPDTPADALAVLEKYGLVDEVPDSIVKALEDAPMPPTVEAHNVLVGNNEMACRAAMAQAEIEGFNTKLITTTLEGEAREVGRELGERLKGIATGIEEVARPAMLVAGGETTVTIQGDGLGGRNQEMALAAVEVLAGISGVALVTLATDGGDGPTDAAGAVVTGETWGRAEVLGLNPRDYLTRNDSYSFFSQLGDCLKPGPTMTNVNDVVFLFLVG